ncbi:MAG: 2-hydroxyacid dehydrogenase [Jiangellales bacterium]
MHVLVPFGVDAPAAVTAHVWESGDLPDADVLDVVEVHVLPYTFDAASFAAVAALPRLRVLQTLTAGYEHVLGHLPDGVTLCNAGGVHDDSTAELALTLMLAAQRGVADFVRAQDAQRWAYAAYPSLADRRVLVVGFGGVGRAIAARLTPFGCHVTPVARTPRPGVHSVDDLPDLLRVAEIVVLAVPLDESTRHLVDDAFLGAMPDGALLVNVSRGPVVDTDALVTQTSAGRLRAALDVTDPEPLPTGHPLWSSPGVLISPHVGGNTSAFRPRARRLVEHQLTRIAAGQPPLHQVAGPTLGP